jgi:hypothetical protein
MSASPATSSASASKEVSIEDTGGAQVAFAGGDAPVNLASAGSDGAEATEVTAEGTESLMEAAMVSIEAAGASMEDLFPDLLGRDSSLDASKASPHGGRSPIHVVEVLMLGARRIVAQVSEEEEDTPDVVWLAVSATFPLHLSKGIIFLLYLVYVFFFLMLFLPECLFVSVGSVTGSLASKEELAADSRIGYARLGMPPPPPPTVQPSP